MYAGRWVSTGLDHRGAVTLRGLGSSDAGEGTS